MGGGGVGCFALGWVFFPPSTSSIIPLYLCDAIRALVIVLLNRIYIQHKSITLTNYVPFDLGNSTDVI